MGRINSSGWSIIVTHPDTGRVLTADVLDDPQLSPSLGPSSPFAELRAPVRKSPAWLDVPTPADMEVYLDGERQPIEELRDVDDRNDRTILVGRGGVEFENRVQAEYRSERRHVAADELLTNETPYTPDVDTPTATVETGELLQDPDTTAEWESLSTGDDTVPGVIENNTVRAAQSCFHLDARTDATADDRSLANDDKYTDGQAALYSLTSNFSEFEIVPEYTIAAADVDIAFLIEGLDADGVEVQASIDGSNLFTGPIAWNQTVLSGFDWYDSTSFGGFQAPGFDLQAGQTYTVRVDVETATGQAVFDRIAVYDSTYENEFTFDSTVHEAGGQIDGPGFYADTQRIPFADSTTAFSFVAGDVTVTMDTGHPAPRVLQLSQDSGQTWIPTDGTEQDTTTVDVDFADPSATLRTRLGLGGFSPNGTRDDSPRENYAAQAADSLELRADISFESLLIDEDFDNDLASILNDVAGDEEFVYSFRFENGTPTVVWTQPGQRTANSTPELAADPRVEKAGTPYDRIVVKGSNERIANEPFTAQTTFQSLVNSRLTTGSETVYDDTQNYDRGTDYEMNYSSGEIRALPDGDLATGTTYRIDYSRTAQGSYAVDPLPADPRQGVLDVAGVVSDRQAEQIAFVLLNEFDDARYRAQVTLPRPDVRFDPVEAQPLGGLSLPAGVTPLEPRGTPEITPRGLSVTLGREQGLDSAARQIGEQLRQITRRT